MKTHSNHSHPIYSTILRRQFGELVAHLETSNIILPGVSQSIKILDTTIRKRVTDKTKFSIVSDSSQDNTLKH